MSARMTDADRLIHAQALNRARRYVKRLVWDEQDRVAVDEFNASKKWWQPRRRYIWELSPVPYGSIPPGKLLDEALEELTPEERELIVPRQRATS